MTTTPTVRVEITKPTASGKRVGWWKRVTTIDRSKKGGWAINGDFLEGGENDLPVGGVVVCCSPRGSAKYSWKAVSVYMITPEGLELVKGEGCDKDGDFDLHTQTPSLLDCIEVAMDLRRVDESTHPLAAFTTEELLAELAYRGELPA